MFLKYHCKDNKIPDKSPRRLLNSLFLSKIVDFFLRTSGLYGFIKFCVLAYGPPLIIHLYQRLQ